MFDGAATWDALADRYHRLIGRAAAGEVVLDSGAISAGIYEGLMPKILSRFLREAGEANIVRFAGHWFDPHRPDECGLIFRDGVLTSASFSAVLDDLPVVFSNACETGLLSPAHGAEGVLWTGVAASFLAAGAVNYLGSMWPVLDELPAGGSVLLRPALRGRTDRRSASAGAAGRLRTQRSHVGGICLVRLPAQPAATPAGLNPPLLMPAASPAVITAGGRHRCSGPGRRLGAGSGR